MYSMNDSELISVLGSLKISTNDTKDIVETAKKQGHYQVACQKHFDITHPNHQQMDGLENNFNVANHPNQWYQVSVNYHKIKNGVKVNANTSTSSESQPQESNSQNEVIKSPAEVTATEVQA